MTKKLVERGAIVRVVDNLSRGKLEYLRDVWDEIEFIKGDLTKLETCTTAVKGMDVVFHMAAVLGAIIYWHMY